MSTLEITGAVDCQEDDTGVVRLDTEVAPTLSSMGIRPTGSLETGATLDSDSYCGHYRTSLYASWAEAQQLATNDGWSFVSHTATYPHTQAM